MEPLPKSKQKNIPRSIKEMSQEVLQETLKKKRECNAKALNIVEKLCEINTDEEWFLANLQFINQCHFEDATVERAITKICGYPLCQQKLEKVPSQQYHISTRYNKVFDITERKNFCSSCCYKSAMHIKKQLFTSPLWFRDQEKIPKYTILKSEKSSMGAEVILLPDKIKPEPEDVKKKINQQEAAIADKTINELKKKCADLKINEEKKNIFKQTESGTVDGTRICNTEKVNEELSNTVNKNEQLKSMEVKSNEVNITDSTCDTEKENRIINNTITKDKTLNSTKIKLSKSREMKVKSKMKEEPVSIARKVEKCIFEWFSLDTLFYIYGEDKLKELFQEKTETVKEMINSKVSLAGPDEKINRLIQLYGLLDTDFDNNEVKRDLKPLPDYSVLKKEGKNLEIKVRAFYQGQLEIKGSVTEEKKEEQKQESSTNSEPIYLPLIDAHAQNILRRKIVLDKLNQVIPELFRIFCSDFVVHMNEVRNLVSSFTLSAHNITFKPSEWYLIGIILIKLLSVKNKKLKAVLNCESSRSHTLLILQNFKLQKDYLDNLLLRLTDFANIMEKLNEIKR